MTRTIDRMSGEGRRFLRSLVAAGALACGSVAAADLDPELAAIWNDPVFQKQFVAGYGVNADIEPRVTPDEVKLLEKVMPHLQAGDYRKAEETLRAKMKPDCSARLDYDLGSILFQQERYPEALEQFEKATQKFRSFRRAYRNIGLIRVRNGDLDAAIEAFTKMIELGGADAYSYGLLGLAFGQKQDFQAAESAYRNALLLQPSNLEWRLGLTRCVFKQGKYQDAAALLDVLIEATPDKGDFWLLQAHAYLGMKQPLKAAENLEALDLIGASTVDSLFTLGDIYLSENLSDLSARAFRRAIDRDPNQSPVRAIKSTEMLAARSELRQARELSSYIRGVWESRLDESARRTLLKLEARLSMAEGNGSPETAAVLEEIVRLDPLDGEALLLLGQHYARDGAPDKAIFYYERAASIEAFEATASLRHAQVLVGMSRYADAVPLIRRVQELRPREDVARYLEQVERLAKSRK